MPPTTLESNVQQYIDQLRVKLKEAEKVNTQRSDRESKLRDGVQKKRDYTGALRGLLDQLISTSDLAIAHIKVLRRAKKQAEKVGKTAKLGISALEILICETEKTMNCVEQLAIYIRQLVDRIDRCKPPVVDDKKSLTAIAKQLKVEIEKGVANSVELINVLYKTLQSQEEVSEKIATKRGLIYEFQAQKFHMKYGTRNDPADTDDPEETADCAACTKRDKPIFPMNDPQCDVYTRLNNTYEAEKTALEKLNNELESATDDRERAQAKKEAIQSALDAAIKAKACENKN